ncbi:MAG TPA: oligosaccharide flippase family protein [Solirubrobacterales bacterium]|nr:oligosaccharide flippase family protein [Solirubrobacterales bacterium]
MSDDKRLRPERDDVGEDLGYGFEAAQPPEPAALGASAARGVGVLVGRTLGLQLLTAGVTVVLARLLTPADYGMFALALSIQLAGQRLAELGMPAALIGQEAEPSAEQQAAMGGAMLSTSLLISGTLFAVAFSLAPALGFDSEALRVVAVAGVAMPLYSARAVPTALLERNLQFGRVALVEAADTLTFNAFALAGALAGFGAFSLAGAVPVGALASMAAAWALQPFARRPRLRLDPLRPMLKFGAQITLVQAINVMQEVGFVAALTAVGGSASAGFYAMAKRLFSFPIALTGAVARVSFPALSRSQGLRPSRAARAALYTTIVAGLPLALVAGAVQPLIGVVLGDAWMPTSDVVLAGSLGMMIAASANATMIGYALAEGAVGSVIAACGFEALLACALAITLTSSLGETGIGLALTVANVGAMFALSIRTHPTIRRSLLFVLKMSLISGVAVLAAQLVGVENDAVGLAVALLTVIAVWFPLQLVFSRNEMRSLFQLIRPMLPGGAPA